MCQIWLTKRLQILSSPLHIFNSWHICALLALRGLAAVVGSNSDIRVRAGGASRGRWGALEQDCTKGHFQASQ